MKYDLKVGDVVQVKESGYGFPPEDVGKWVEIVKFGTYTSGCKAVFVKLYDEPIFSKSGSDGNWFCGFETFGENPMILLNTLEEQSPVVAANAKKHNHYFKDCPYDKVDVYRVLEVFSVTDPCIQHATKKLLVAGGRGHKDIGRDIQDVIDTLERWKQMRKEESV